MSNIREAGLKDARNVEFMKKGYPPGPPKEVAKRLNLRDINTYMRLHEEFGDIFMLPLGAVPLVVTRNPRHIRSLLGGSATEDFPRPKNVIENIRILFGRAQIALDGKEHQENKRMLSAWLFSEEHNAMMTGPFTEIILDFIGRLEENFGKDRNVDAYRIAELAAADLSASLSMGRTYKALEKGYCPQLDALKKCDRIFLNRAMNKRWKETEKPETTKEFEENKKLIADTFATAFEEIKGGKQVNHNIISHMIEANLANRSAECPMGRNPTEYEAVGNMVGFLAGVGNTARMLTTGIEMMARRQEDQKRILAELHEVLNGKSKKDAWKAAESGMAVPGSRNENLYSFEKIMNLHFLRCFMYEALRLYTPSTSVAPRACSKPSQLGEFTIPAGTNTMCNIYGAHRHPEFWRNPEEFDPMRFNENGPGEPVQVKGFVEEGFFPFGYGGHSCIGKNLAQLATLMMWAMLVSNHRLCKTPGKPEAEFNTLKSDQILGFIEPVNGCHISLEERPHDAVLDEAANKLVAEETPKRKAAERAAVEALKHKTSEIVDVQKRQIPMSEVEMHSTRETGVWFVIDNKVYDVTPWLSDHPGGGSILLRSAGKDVTKLFELTKHSSFAIEEAKKYQIGVLAPSSKI